MDNNIEWKSALINDLKIKYFESDGSSEWPLVLIPGWPVSSCVFEPLAKTIGHKLKYFAVNLPGFGGSQFCNEKICGFDYHVDFLEKFRKEIIKTKKINLFGYSTGGCCAINFASHFPKSVDKLILFSPPYDGIAHWHDTLQKQSKVIKFFNFVHRNHWLLPFLNSALFKKTMAHFAMKQFYVSGKYPKLWRMPKEFIDKIIEETCQFNSRVAMEMGEDLIVRDFSKEAKGVLAKTLVIAPSNDEAVPPFWSSRLAKNILSKGKYIEIPNTDHSAVVTEPEKIAPVVVDFLLS